MPPFQWMSTYATHQDEHTHTHTHARGHTYARMHMYAHIHACTCRTHARARAHTHTHTHTHVHTYEIFDRVTKNKCTRNLGGCGGYFLACEEFSGRIYDSFPARAFFFFFLSGDQLMHTSSTFQARIRPLWLSEIWCALLCTFAHVGHRSNE